jgi:hypothetical protein
VLAPIWNDAPLATATARAGQKGFDVEPDGGRSHLSTCLPRPFVRPAARSLSFSTVIRLVGDLARNSRDHLDLVTAGRHPSNLRNDDGNFDRSPPLVLAQQMRSWIQLIVSHLIAKRSSVQLFTLAWSSEHSSAAIGWRAYSQLRQSSAGS